MPTDNRDHRLDKRCQRTKGLTIDVNINRDKMSKEKFQVRKSQQKTQEIPNKNVLTGNSGKPRGVR